MKTVFLLVAKAKSQNGNEIFKTESGKPSFSTHHAPMFSH